MENTGSLSPRSIWYQEWINKYLLHVFHPTFVALIQSLDVEVECLTSCLYPKKSRLPQPASQTEWFKNKGKFFYQGKHRAACLYQTPHREAGTELQRYPAWTSPSRLGGDTPRRAFYSTGHPPTSHLDWGSQYENHQSYRFPQQSGEQYSKN